MNIKLILEYDGMDFCGWQHQPGQRSVQETIERAIATLTGQTVRVHGSGRTDAGVHAYGQVANVHVETDIPPARFAAALNSLLPSDVKALRSETVADDWHARFNARGKLYCYKLLISDTPRPLERHRAYRVGKSFDVQGVIGTLPLFLGRHDFVSFSAKNSDRQSTERTITRAEFVQQGEDCEIFIGGDGFLYHMVRIIVGELVGVAFGKVAPEEVARALATGQRARAPVTAPAHGLYLMSVIY